MRGASGSGAEVTTVEGLSALPAARLCLVVVAEGGCVTYPLPERGELTIGRAHDCGVQVDDPSVSREHARLAIGATLTVTDLGSANGTRLSEQRLEPHHPAPLCPDQLVELGSTLLIVQRSGVLGERRLWTHGYFEARLEDECARAAARGTSFAVVRLDVRRASDASGTVQEALDRALSSEDVVAAYGPDEYELLLPGVTVERAGECAARVRARLAELGLASDVGIACFPAAGRSPDALMAAASAELRGAPAESPRPLHPVIEDPAMLDIYRMLERIAQGTLSVLLLGETGVGKEVLAEAIHRRSPRAAGPLVRLNCSALSESLLDSELFGHEKGAFTGAVASKRGLLESADGGTLFLDEVGELPLSTQVKLLRVLEDRQVLPVGGLKPRRIDVRVVSATNRDLEQAIGEGRFRADLYFRLSGASLLVPPLRERVAEIQPLAQAFVAAASAAARLGRPPVLTEEALDLLERYAWPGNIRELRNVMERAVLLAADGEIGPAQLPVEKMTAAALSPTWAQPAGAPTLGPLRRGGAPADERELILQALERCGGNQTQAARLLGVSRRTLINRIEAYGLPRPRKGP